MSYAEVSLINLNDSTPDYDLTSNGHIFVKEDYNQNIDTTVFDLDIYEENTGLWYAYDRFKLVEGMVSDVTVTGRLYQGDVGYVDISTVEPLTECHDVNCSPTRPSNGSLEFKGANQSKVIFEFKDDDYSVPKGHIEILTTNQDLVEPERSTYNWRKMESWKNNNSAPELSVYFYSFTPTQTVENIEIDVSTYDQDRDEVELTYTWYVNDVEVINDYIDADSASPNIEPNILPKYYFKSGDIVKVKVTANDGFYNDQEISTTVTTPEIYNVSPTIVLDEGIPSSFYYVDYYVASHVGNTGVLDASPSYDADGDMLEFKWTSFNNDQELIIENPNSAKTNVTCGSYYGCDNLCFTLEVSELRNGERLNTFSDDLDICFTD